MTAWSDRAEASVSGPERRMNVRWEYTKTVRGDVRSMTVSGTFSTSRQLSVADPVWAFRIFTHAPLMIGIVLAVVAFVPDNTAFALEG